MASGASPSLKTLLIFICKTYLYNITSVALVKAVRTVIYLLHWSKSSLNCFIVLSYWSPLFQNNFISSDEFGNFLVKTHGIYRLIASFLLDACFGLSSQVFQNTLHPLVSSLLLSRHEPIYVFLFPFVFLMVIGNLCFFKERQCEERKQGRTLKLAGRCSGGNSNSSNSGTVKR